MKQCRYLFSSFAFTFFFQSFALAADNVRSNDVDEDTLRAKFSLRTFHDDNTFRIKNNTSSDNVTVTTAGFVFDKKYSLQRLYLDFGISTNKYSNNDFLNYNALNYKGIWYWYLTPSLGGVISLSRSERLNDFRNYRIFAKNIRTIDTLNILSEYSPFRTWATVLGYTYLKSSNSANFFQDTGFNADSFDYGLKYYFSSGSILGILGHHKVGNYDNRFLDPALLQDNKYVEDEYEIDFFLKESEKLRVTSKLSYLDHRYENFSIRDYSDYAGDIRVDYKLSDKLSLGGNLTREITPFVTFTSTYSATNSLKLDANYSVTPKLSCNLSLINSVRMFKGRAQFSKSNRKDDENYYSGAVNWDPLQNIRVSISYLKANRDSTDNAFDYADNITSLNFDFKI